MNTFYGEAGNVISSFFLLPLVGGVTTYGQYNIKLVKTFVEDQGFGVKYGDTDSLYLTCPPRAFANLPLDIQYTQLCIDKVNVTMVWLDKLRDKVNNMLLLDNGSTYLSMAYEEVLFPVVFAGKKKYYGIEHINIPNFDNPHLFVRGIEIVKRGKLGIMKKIGTRIMLQSLELIPPNGIRRTLDRIVEDVLQDSLVNTSQWVVDDFIQSDVFRPSKKNIAVQRFVERMGEDLSPKPFERFKYILAKRPPMVTMSGRLIPFKKGDLMEYPSDQIEIDILYYLLNYVSGLCARFIHDDEIDDDQKAQKTAKAKIDILIEQHYTGKTNKEMLSDRRSRCRLGLPEIFIADATNPIETIDSYETAIQKLEKYAKIIDDAKKNINPAPPVRRKKPRFSHNSYSLLLPRTTNDIINRIIIKNLEKSYDIFQRVKKQIILKQPVSLNIEKSIANYIGALIVLITHQ